MLTDLSDLG